MFSQANLWRQNNNVTHKCYDYNDLLTIQSIIERSAQSSLVALYQQSKASYKSDGSIVTDADLAMQALLAKELAASYPEVNMLSEEIDHEAQQQAISSQQD